ncbi:MAG: conserved rane protein of unknown function [Clostridia bacterium]|nr:conserved rane protein of unknown function [Clostridia bacterium]
MAELFKINVIYSTSHLVVPKIVTGILIILGLIILVQEFMKKKKEGTTFSFKDKKFFEENYDKIKFWGSLVLFVLYIALLDILGFLISGLIFVFLFNVLFAGTKNIKSIMVSGIISIVSSVSIWYVFGTLFNITLP